MSQIWHFIDLRPALNVVFDNRIRRFHASEKMFKKNQKTVDTALTLWDSASTHGNNKTVNMRTKLLAAAAILAAGLASSMAQNNVYSLNVVGYVNKPLAAGFNLISNPLNTTNNTLSGLFASPGFGDTIYKFNGTSFDISTYVGSWSPDQSLAPGEGVFYQAGAAFTNTFVGEVMQGSLANPIPAGFSIRSSQVPETNTLANLNFPAAFGDTVYYFRGGTYEISTYVGAWSPDVGPAVGEAFWVNAGAATQWTRNFTVAP